MPLVQWYLSLALLLGNMGHCSREIGNHADQLPFSQCSSLNSNDTMASEEQELLSREPMRPAESGPLNLWRSTSGYGLYSEMLDVDSDRRADRELTHNPLPDYNQTSSVESEEVYELSYYNDFAMLNPVDVSYTLQRQERDSNNMSSPELRKCASTSAGHLARSTSSLSDAELPRPHSPRPFQPVSPFRSMDMLDTVLSDRLLNKAVQYLGCSFKTLQAKRSIIKSVECTTDNEHEALKCTLKHIALAEIDVGLGLLPQPYRTSLLSSVDSVFSGRLDMIGDWMVMDIVVAMGIALSHSVNGLARLQRIDQLLFVLDVPLFARGTLVSLVKSIHLWPSDYGIRVLCMTAFIVSKTNGMAKQLSVDFVNNLAACLWDNTDNCSDYSPQRSFYEQADHLNGEIDIEAQAPYALPEPIAHFSPSTWDHIVGVIVHLWETVYSNGSDELAEDHESDDECPYFWSRWIFDSATVLLDQAAHRLAILSLLFNPGHDTQFYDSILSLARLWEQAYPIYGTPIDRTILLFMSDILALRESAGSLTGLPLLHSPLSFENIRIKQSMDMLKHAKHSKLEITANSLRLERHPSGEMLADAVDLMAILQDDFWTNTDSQQITWGWASKHTRYLNNLSAALAAPWDTASFSEADISSSHGYYSQYARQMGVHPLLFEYVLDTYVLRHTDASMAPDLHMVLNADAVIDAYIRGALPLQFNARRVLTAILRMQTVNVVAAVRLGCLYMFASAIVKGNALQIAPFVSNGANESAYALTGIVEKDLDALGIAHTTENVSILLALAAYYSPTSTRLIPDTMLSATSIIKPVMFFKQLLRQQLLEEALFQVVEKLLDLFTDTTGNMSIRSVLYVLRCIDQYRSNIHLSSLSIPADISGSVPIHEQTQSLDISDAREDDYMPRRTPNDTLLQQIHASFVSNLLSSQSSTDITTLRQRLQTLNYSDRAVADMVEILQKSDATELQFTADQVLNAHIVAGYPMDE